MQAAVAQAIAGLDGRAASVVLVFPDAALPREAVIEQATSAAPGVPLAGMSSAGLIAGDGLIAAGCAATAFTTEMHVGIGVGADATGDLRAAARAATETAMEGIVPQPGRTVLLLFLDPHSGDQALAVDGAYSVVGAQVPLAGGGANGFTPMLIGDQTCRSDAVVAVCLVSPAPISIGIGQGCRPLSQLAIATRTDGRTVRELDGRPADEVYLEGLGRADEELSDSEFESLAVLHPLGQPELRGLLRLRHVMGRAAGGGLRCSTPVPPTAAVWFTTQSPESIVDSARQAAAEALTPIAGPPRAVLIFDCAARRRALGDALEAEADGLLDALGNPASVTGLFTRGEIARTRGAKGDRNHAVVVVTFG